MTVLPALSGVSVSESRLLLSQLCSASSSAVTDSGTLKSRSLIDLRLARRGVCSSTTSSSKLESMVSSPGCLPLAELAMDSGLNNTVFGLFPTAVVFPFARGVRSASYPSAP